MSSDGDGIESEDLENGEEDEDEDDEMLSRFEAKMNALIAEGQAALNSTPTLHDLTSGILTHLHQALQLA